MDKVHVYIYINLIFAILLPETAKKYEKDAIFHRSSLNFPFNIVSLQCKTLGADMDLTAG